MRIALVSVLVLGLTACVQTNIPKGMLDNSNPSESKSVDDMVAVAAVGFMQKIYGITRPIIIHGGEVSGTVLDRKLFGPPHEGVCVKMKNQFKLLESTPHETLQFIRVENAAGKIRVSVNSNSASGVLCSGNLVYRPLPQIAAVAKANGFGPSE